MHSSRIMSYRPRRAASTNITDECRLLLLITSHAGGRACRTRCQLPVEHWRKRGTLTSLSSCLHSWPVVWWLVVRVAGLYTRCRLAGQCGNTVFLTYILCKCRLPLALKLPSPCPLLPAFGLIPLWCWRPLWISPHDVVWQSRLTMAAVGLLPRWHSLWTEEKILKTRSHWNRNTHTTNTSKCCRIAMFRCR